VCADPPRLVCQVVTSAHFFELKLTFQEYTMWQEIDGKLEKEFKLLDFRQAIDFVNQVAIIAHNLKQTPEVLIAVNRVTLKLGNDQKDTSLTRQIDMLQKAQDQKDENIPEVGEVKMYSDGGSRGNPGPSALGFVILDMGDKVLYAGGEYLGITTNNQAEYQSLKAGLKYAKKMKAKEVHVFMDSMLVVNQMKGIFKVKNRDLWPIYESCKELSAQFSKIHFSHVPRELNKLADAQVNKCLDEQAK
jgi:ribonuclease HI